jgi:cytochrome b561
MIWGILTAAVFVLASAAFFAGKLGKRSSVKKPFFVVHKALGYLFWVIAAVHLGWLCR